MVFYLGLIILSFVVTVSIIAPFINILYRLKFLRKKETEDIKPTDSREFKQLKELHSKKAGTPTGLGVLLVCLIPILFIATFPIIKKFNFAGNLLSGFDLHNELIVIFVTFIGFGLLGLYDDILKIFGFEKTGFFGLRRWHKFLIQWILALIVAFQLYFSFGIDFVYVPFFGELNLGWGYLFLAAFVITTFANAFDITSGLDALGEGLLMICLIVFLIISASQLDRVLLGFVSIWLGSLIAGIYFTIHPARAFLGNASGMAFGSTLALVGLLSGKFVPLLVVGGVFLIDGGSSLLQILSKGLFKRRIFPIAPVHHWLEIIGWEEPKIVARAWLLGLALALFGLWLSYL